MTLDEIANYEKFQKIDLPYQKWCEVTRLPEYSATLPTGVVPGKRWRRHDGAHDPSVKNAVWLVGEYGPEVDGRCAVIFYRPRVRVGAITTRMVPFRLGNLTRDEHAEVETWWDDNLGYHPGVENVGMKGRYAPHLIFRKDADAVAFVLTWGHHWLTKEWSD